MYKMRAYYRAAKAIYPGKAKIIQIGEKSFAVFIVHDTVGLVHYSKIDTFEQARKTIFDFSPVGFHGRRILWGRVE